MNKFTINKAIISDSKITLFLNQSVEDDFIERLEHYFRVIDETNHIMKNSFLEIIIQTQTKQITTTTKQTTK